VAGEGLFPRPGALRWLLDSVSVAAKTLSIVGSAARPVYCRWTPAGRADGLVGRHGARSASDVRDVAQRPRGRLHNVSAIKWRKSIRICRTSWALAPLACRGDTFDADGMLPAIAKVVEVFERPGADIFQHVDEAGLAGIERPVAEVRIGPAPADITCTDLVEIAVRPAMAACSTRCRRSRRIVSGTSTRRTTAGSTSSSLIRRRAMRAAVMPRGYGSLGWAASATEATRGDGKPDDRQCAPTRQRARRVDRHRSIWR